MNNVLIDNITGLKVSVDLDFNINDNIDVIKENLSELQSKERFVIQVSYNPFDDRIKTSIFKDDKITLMDKLNYAFKVSGEVKYFDNYKSAEKVSKEIEKNYLYGTKLNSNKNCLKGE